SLPGWWRPSPPPGWSRAAQASPETERDGTATRAAPPAWCRWRRRREGSRSAERSRPTPPCRTVLGDELGIQVLNAASHGSHLVVLDRHAPPLLHGSARSLRVGEGRIEGVV